MTHPTRAFSGSIINRFTGSKILARVGQISVAFPKGNSRRHLGKNINNRDNDSGLTKYNTAK